MKIIRYKFFKDESEFVDWQILNGVNICILNVIPFPTRTEGNQNNNESFNMDLIFSVFVTYIEEIKETVVE